MPFLNQVKVAPLTEVAVKATEPFKQIAKEPFAETAGAIGGVFMVSTEGVEAGPAQPEERAVTV